LFARRGNSTQNSSRRPVWRVNLKLHRSALPVSDTVAILCPATHSNAHGEQARSSTAHTPAISLFSQALLSSALLVCCVFFRRLFHLLLFLSWPKQAFGAVCTGGSVGVGVLHFCEVFLNRIMHAPQLLLAHATLPPLFALGRR